MTVKRLLIIDDEADFGTSVRKVAEKLGFEVETATQGRKFKEIYKRFDPTLIVLDMVMPEEDGIELVQWLASVQCTARIIIISGFTPIYSDAAITFAAAEGLLPISRLAKPVSLATLTSALQEPDTPSKSPS